MVAANSQASSSSSAIREAIPEREAWRFAPPRPAASTSPLMTSGVSRGEERKSWPCSSPKMVKSEREAASAETPTTGPRTTLIIGMRPLHCTKRSNISPVPASAFTPSCARWPPPSHMAMRGAFARSAISTILAIFRACISPMLPPWTLKS